MTQQYALKIIPLQSSSSGNCIYVESNGTGLVFDAGISCRMITRRLADFNVSTEKIQGLFISHEHSDHISGAGPFHRQYQFPLYATHSTLEAAEEKLKNLHEIRYIQHARPVRIGPLTVHTVKTPHDCSDGVCFIIEGGGKLFGIFTDIGKPEAGIARALTKLDAALFESNYDERMLTDSHYPLFLKKRISSGKGHLSNAQSANMLGQYGKKLKWVCLAHLSIDNNSRQLAYKSVSETVGKKSQVIVASRTSSTGILYV